ncbi:MAG: channel protein, hemolysin family [Deltaproteobacteria bacterium]|nr:channel protein, hemolysin family [Deltaproteobacteria bacterium]
MTQTSASRERTQSPGEETANSVSHAVGLAAALAAAPVLVLSAVRDGGAARIAGASVFAAAMVLLYLTSTLYHALPMNRAKRVFQVLDHAAIFLMIAGTYTPFTLGVLRGTWGWTLFGLIWALALAGVVLTAAGGVRYPKLTTSLYLGMGWLILVAVKPLWLRMPSEGLFWLLAGGIAYTVGVVFYAAKRVRYCHFVWHLFVIAGTTCHFIAVLRFAG